MIQAVTKPHLVCLRCGAGSDYEVPLHCHYCGAALVIERDAPTMGEQFESELSKWSCVCGEPATPGVVHRSDGPCYHVPDLVVTRNGKVLTDQQRGLQEFKERCERKEPGDAPL